MSQILTFQILHKGFPPTQCRTPTNNHFIRHALQNYVIEDMFYVKRNSKLTCDWPGFRVTTCILCLLIRNPQPKRTDFSFQFIVDLMN